MPAALAAGLAAVGHPLRDAWLAVGVAAGVIEVVGFFRWRPEAQRRDQGSLIGIRLAGAAGALIAVLALRYVPGADIHPAAVVVAVGLVVFAAGEGMRAWAKLTLGRYFTYTVMTSADQPVIDTGPYRFLRHPAYTGTLLMAAGLGAALGNWLALAGLVVMVGAGVAFRIHVEEKALLADLGERYLRFAAGRKRLIPFVW